MTLSRRSKIIGGTLLGLLAGGSTIYYLFFRVMICCPSGGGPCREIDRASDCKAPDLVSSCGCPSTKPDGGVDCGC